MLRSVRFDTRPRGIKIEESLDRKNLVKVCIDGWSGHIGLLDAVEGVHQIAAGTSGCHSVTNSVMSTSDLENGTRC